MKIEINASANKDHDAFGVSEPRAAELSMALLNVLVTRTLPTIMSKGKRPSEPEMLGMLADMFADKDTTTNEMMYIMYAFGRAIGKAMEATEAARRELGLE